MLKELKFFITYLLIWISSNLSIPFWMLGHFHLMSNVYEDIQEIIGHKVEMSQHPKHLMSNVYEDIQEIIASFSMNILVFIGFLLDYKQQRKNNG